jgi:hypothetical protein
LRPFGAQALNDIRDYVEVRDEPKARCEPPAAGAGAKFPRFLLAKLSKLVEQPSASMVWAPIVGMRAPVL